MSSGFSRRELLRLSALGGLAVAAPGRAAGAGSATWSGPLWVTVHAEGGWDPTLFCDPKGGTAGDKSSVNQSYAPEAITSARGIPVAPTSLRLDDGAGGKRAFYSAAQFFEAVGGQVRVLNGVDTATNNHETGARTVLSGRPQEGYPNLAALAAGVAYATVPAPMAFLSWGGYDQTGGAVPLTRSSNADALWRVAFPNRVDPKKPDGNTYLPGDTFARVQAAQADRVARQLGRAPLPARRAALSTLFASRSGETGLADIASKLPAAAAEVEQLPEFAGFPGGAAGQLGALENFMRQVQLAVAAFSAGVGVGANLVMGGFDTHSDHDNAHGTRLVQLLRGVHYLLEQAAAAGLADRLYVLVGSDFGRTPYYNAGNGKDHWAVTSMLVAGPGISGGRVLGATDAQFRPLALHKGSLAADSSGVKLRPEHVHAALRRYAGLDSAALSRAWPVTADALPLLV
jgi:uncharacterized protein (DUF1501 family)